VISHGTSLVQPTRPRRPPLPCPPRSTHNPDRPGPPRSTRHTPRPICDLHPVTRPAPTSSR